MVIRKTEVDKFLSILTQGNIRLLMEKDKCCNYIDNYLLATVLVYFKRAGLDLGEYTEENFWRCLYLAHDQVGCSHATKYYFPQFTITKAKLCIVSCQEEDEEELKWELLAWAMGDSWKKDIKAFLNAKDAIWKRMEFRYDSFSNYSINIDLSDLLYLGSSASRSWACLGTPVSGQGKIKERERNDDIANNN